MSKKTIYSPSAPQPVGPYSQAILSNGFLFISGQIALDPKTGAMVQQSIEEETNQVLNNIEAILKAAGMSFSNVVKTTIFLSDINNFAKVNEIYASRFAENPPARETVEVSKLPKNGNVEISCVAVE